MEEAEFQKLTIRVMDEESVEKAEYIGACELAIRDVSFFARWLS